MKCDTRLIKAKRLGRLSSVPQLRRPVGIAVDNELALNPDVTEDGEADAGVALDAAEALAGSGGRGVVDVGAGDGAGVGADGEANVREGGAAGEDVSTVGLAVGRALDGGVVGGDDGVVGEEEGGSGVGDGLEGAGDGEPPAMV